MTNIFLPGIGQFDNIGDIILRRQLVEWLIPLGRLHVFVGQSPEGFAEALGLRDTDVVYRSFSAWYRAALREALRGDAAYAFKAGEIQLTVVGMKEHVSVLPLLLALKARGGSVVRVGSGSRNFARLPRLLIQPSILLSDLTVWRDARTAGYLGRGGVMPDLAFGEGLPTTELSAEGRDTLVVSMRSDRAFPNAAWIEAVKRYAADNGLRILAVTQVLRDRDRSRELAAALGAELMDWDGTDHGGQEERLREAYRRTALVVSDRLHVLITATTEGALPLALLVDTSDKIARHFDAAGISGVGVPSASLSVDQLLAVLTAAGSSRERVAAGLTGARARLAEVRSAVGAKLGGAEAVAELAR